MNFEKTVIGYKEYIKVGINGDVYTFTATMDTGNAGVVPTIGIELMEIMNTKIKATIQNKEYVFERKGEASPMVGNVIHRRPIVLLDFLEIKGKRVDNVYFAITDERKKSTQALINRDTLRNMNFIIDPSIEFT